MMTEAIDQNEPMGNEPQVATRTSVGPPPAKPPSPLPETCMTHADDVTEDWASDDDNSNVTNVSETKGLGDRNMVSNDDISDDECSNQDSDDDTSDASEDAISVLAQAAVEEVMEAAVRQAQISSANDATQDSVITNCAVSHGEQERSSMEANNSPHARPISAADNRLSGSLFQPYPDNEDSEEDEERWHVGENSPPPSQQSPISSCPPFSANQVKTSDHSGDDNDDAQPLQEVKTLTCSNSPPSSDPAPVVPQPRTPNSFIAAPHVPQPVTPDPVASPPMTSDSVVLNQ